MNKWECAGRASPRRIAAHRLDETRIVEVDTRAVHGRNTLSECWSDPDWRRTGGRGLFMRELSYPYRRRPGHRPLAGLADRQSAPAL